MGRSEQSAQIGDHSGVGHGETIAYGPQVPVEIKFHFERACDLFMNRIDLTWDTLDDHLDKMEALVTTKIEASEGQLKKRYKT